MKQLSRVSVLLSVVLLVGVLTLVSGGAAAQDPDLNLSEGDSQQGPDVEIEEQLGDLIIHSYEFSGEQLRVRLTWRGETPTTLGVSQIGSGSRALISQTRLLPGEETQVSLDAVSSSDPAVAWTSESLSRQRAAVLKPSGGGFGSIETTLLRGSLIGISVGLIGTFIAAYRYRNKTEVESGWDNL